MLKISPLAADCARNAILITGSARSGTTLMGKIVSSFHGVEYAFEPPMLFTLFSLVGDLNEYHWRLLYETYLYEDFLINALAGRNLNLNRIDDSAAHQVKSKEEIERRLNTSLRKEEAERLTRGTTLAYKMPDVVPMVPTVKTYYPETRVVFMLRDAVGTINSILQKKWFSKEAIGKSLVWPFCIFGDLRVPFWVKPEDREYWTTLSELDRAAYYYVRVNEGVENIPGRFEVVYDDLVAKPGLVVGKLIEELGMRHGPRTGEIVAGIRRSENNCDLFVMGNINSDLRARVKHFSDRLVPG